MYGFLLVSVLMGCSQRNDESAFNVTAASEASSSVTAANVMAARGSNDTLQINQLTENTEQTESIIHESVDVLYYENGYPYIHDLLTNNTDNTITETEYCMPAYDIDGQPLKLYWNFLDSSAECSLKMVLHGAIRNMIISSKLMQAFNAKITLRLSDAAQKAHGTMFRVFFSLKEDILQMLLIPYNNVRYSLKL